MRKTIVINGVSVDCTELNGTWYVMFPKLPGIVLEHGAMIYGRHRANDEPFSGAIVKGSFGCTNITDGVRTVLLVKDPANDRLCTVKYTDTPEVVYKSEKTKRSVRHGKTRGS